jgi:uncharacterized damage-inducible protein DinB
LTRAEPPSVYREVTWRAARSLRFRGSGGLVQYVAYVVAHESHHRGSILLTLKQCGHPVDQDTRYAIWDWDRI